MEITKSLLFAIIIVAQIIGLVAIIWCTHLLPLSYMHYSLVTYGLFSLIITVGTCVTLLEIHD